MNTRPDFDTAVLLARLRLHARKQLGLVLDTDRLQSDRAYAGEVLQGIQDSSEDAILLSLAGSLRSRLLPVEVEPEGQTQQPAPSAEQVRDYRFGARG